ncbi:MAG: hypothetical protein HYX54_10580 [Chloroflexi bacterium]|nr:hypothetical protein [Chloroflexota bacterium]
MPTRILVVGGGGREHALAWKLAAEPGVNEVVVGPGNSAMALLDRVRIEPSLNAVEPSSIIDLARRVAAELVVVGPEGPLAVGLTDALRVAGFPVFGPAKAAARLETSKAFCHEVAAAAGVPMARARAFAGDEFEAAAAFARDLAGAGLGIVLKADGLAGGKGVIVTEGLDQAVGLLPSFLARSVADC